MDVVYKLHLPNEVLIHIDQYIGGTAYWEARYRLTVANAKLDVFSSDWWTQWHSYLKWYHWRQKHTLTEGKYLPPKRIDEWTKSECIPKRLRGIMDDREVKLLLRLFKASVLDVRMLCILDMKLNISYNAWLTHASFYREIVFE